MNAEKPVVQGVRTGTGGGEEVANGEGMGEIKA
jgi:hypothetical protein